MRYFVAIMVPSPQAAHVRHLQGMLGSRFKVGPHITLIPPAEVHADVDVVAEFDKLQLTVRQFRVRFAGLGSFSNAGKRVLYFNVFPLLSLLNLREQLLSQITWAKQGSRGYLPHITIAEGLSFYDERLAKDRLQDKQLEYEFQCQEVALLAKEGSGLQWEVVATKILY